MIKRRDKEDNVYTRLLRQALADIQALSGNRWTDFNAHDPGVTILENALYALTEMQYHLQFPFETYLYRTKYAQSRLFPTEKIATPSLVTPADYERLICDNIEDVEDCCVSISDKGTYIIRVKTAADKTAVSNRIIELYHANRNLCETLDEIVFEDQIARNNDTNVVADDVPQFVPPTKNETLNQSLPDEYYSFQYNFPDTYGINEKGAPAGCTPVRKAQILQLKAYLLIFDYLMANALHQAGNIVDLLQLSDKLPPPYCPNFSIDDMDKLIDQESFKDNELYDTDFWRKQKSRLLDVLDMIYGEDTKLFFLREENLDQQNKKRMKLIKILPQLNLNRFRSFNILEENDKDDCPLKQLITILLGYDNREKNSVEMILPKYNLHLISDQNFFQNYDNLDTKHILRYIESKSFTCRLETIPEIHLIFKEEMFGELEKNLSFFWYNLLFESLLEHGTTLDNYRIIHNFETDTFLLVFILPDSENWINLGFSADKPLLIRSANQLKSFLKSLKYDFTNIYLLEHILFDSNAENFNKLTIVLAELPEVSNDKKKYETLVRERIPAHLDVDFLWLEPHQLYDFEQNYHLWRNKKIRNEKQKNEE
jgi:hypothetical protein